MQLFSQLCTDCIFEHRHGGLAKQDNGIRRFHCSDGRTCGHGRKGGRDSRFSAAFSPRFFAVDVVVRNRKGKMRVGNDGADCRRDDALRWMAGVKKTLALLNSVLLFRMNRLLIWHNLNS